jgi:hypothetical protein
MGKPHPELPTSSHSLCETDLVFLDGSSKLMLTSQHTIIRTIIRDATELLRATILANNAFPDPILSFNYAKHALISAAQNNSSGAVVLRRLQDDDDYLAKLVTLVCLQISGMS